MEIFNTFAENYTLMIPIAAFMFLKKGLLNILSLSLLMGIFLFQTQFVDVQFYIIVFVIANIIPKGREELREMGLRYISSTCLLVHLILNIRTEPFINPYLFLVTMFLILITVSGIEKKMLTIALTCFPIITSEIGGVVLVLLLTPFILLPLLHEKLKARDFSLFCLACIIILGRFGAEQVFVSSVGYIILSSFIILNSKRCNKEIVAS